MIQNDKLKLYLLHKHNLMYFLKMEKAISHRPVKIYHNNLLRFSHWSEQKYGRQTECICKSSLTAGGAYEQQK